MSYVRLKNDEKIDSYPVELILFKESHRERDVSWLRRDNP